jgi:TonB-dependent receptor
MSARSIRVPLCVALCTMSAVYAAPSMAAESRDFDIKAQSLASALNDFGRQAEVQIFFPRASIASLRAPAVRGNMSRTTALRRLIAGSGLEIRSDDGKTVVLGTTVPQSSSIAADRAPAGHRVHSIVGTVRSETGALLAGAQVRIDGSDRVAVTDTNGRFTLASLPAEAASLSISYFGLTTQSVAIPGDGSAIDVTLVSDAEADGVIVTGQRTIAESEEAAIQIKRASNALVDVVAADSIGRFPDQNIAAAIGRLPGVGLGRDQGQERYVSLRGAPTRWTTLSFDGVNVVGPEGRTARFDVIPATIASQVIVRKAVTPNMAGETVAGNIDIVTRSPFDYAGSKAAVDLGYGFNDLGNGKQLNASGFLSHRFANDTLGVLVSATHYERDMVTDNFENEWEISPEDQEAGGDERIWNVKAKNKLYRLNRSNTAFTGRLEWRPDDANKVFLSSIFTKFRDAELRNSYNFDFDQDARSTATTAVGMTTGYGDIRGGNTPMQGVIYGGDLETSLNNSLTEQRIFTNTLGGTHQLGGWKANWRLNFTRSDTHYKHPFQSNWAGASDPLDRPAFVYDFTDPSFSRIGLYQTVRNADGTYGVGAERPYITDADQTFTSASRNDQLERTDAYTARLDLERHVSLFGADTLIQFGGQYDKRTKSFERTLLNVTAADLTAAGIALPTASQIAEDTPYKGRLPLAYGFDYFSADTTAALFDSWIDQGIAHTNAFDREQNYYKVSEQIGAGYAMGTTYFPWGNIVYGARVEYVKNTGQAFVNFGSNDYRMVDTGSDTLMVFPSAHINWDLNRDMKARLSFNTGAARPDYTNLRPNFSFSDTNEEVSGGNPDARPEKAWGIDAYFEWYMPSRGFFSAGAYYKKLDDILYDVELNEFGRNVLDSDGIIRSTYGYSTISNGGSGHIAGIELSYVQPLEDLVLSAGLPDWAAGFGLRGTLTLNDSKAKTPDGRKTDLPGASDVIYNASVYYERYGFSARVAWQWQSGYLDALGGSPVIGDAYWDKVGRLDFSARYNLNRNVQLYVDANNLTNEPGIRYQGDRVRPIEFESFGRRYMAGARFNF